MHTTQPSYLFLPFVLLLSTCQSPGPPSPPDYSTTVVVEEATRLSANAVVADIDGDGLNDVVLAIGRHWPGPNLLFRGDGLGGFTSVDTLSIPEDRSYSISANDMDGDGDLDLVVSNDRPDPKYVLLNDGLGGFEERVEFGDPLWPTRNSTVADINLDGRPDVIVANRDNSPEGNNFVCLNTTDVSFALTCHSIVSGPATTISVADINRDGVPDLIVPYRDAGQSHVYFGDGTGAFDDRTPFGPSDASFRSAIAIDQNHNGLLDIVAIDARKNATFIFLQSPSGEFAEGVRIDNGEIAPYALYQADLDRDGRQDILVGYREAPSQIFFNRADGMAGLVVGDSSGSAYGFGVGDVNRDGIPDIVLARSGASDVMFLGREAPPASDR